MMMMMLVVMMIMMMVMVIMTMMILMMAYDGDDDTDDDDDDNDDDDNNKYFSFVLFSVCNLVNSSTVALVAIGSCRFHNDLALRTASDLPLPLVVVEVGMPCRGSVAWDQRVFSATSRFHWIPRVVADAMAFLRTSQLMIVYSAECESQHHLCNLNQKKIENRDEC